MNSKMKTLSLAVLGFVGFAAASSAMAQCPTSFSPTPWTATQALGGTVASSAGGYASTACKMDSKLTAAGGFSSAFVRDDTPANESRYRAQFLVNVDALNGLAISQTVRLFAATTTAPALTVSDVVAVTVFGDFGGTQKVLGVSTACSSAATGRCSTSIPLTGATAGVNRIEIDWVKGAAGTGYLKVWVNNATEATHTAKIDVDNSAWGGIDSAVLGLTAASSGFAPAQLNKSVFFDQFDSRRQTFIGN